VIERSGKELIMKMVMWIVVIVAVIGVAWWYFGQPKPGSPGAAEKAGIALDQAAESAGEAAGAAKVKTGEALEKAGSAIENTGKKMQD
jgi:hypothetical protein